MVLVLAEAVDEMVQLRMQEESRSEGGDDDFSEAWCRRLGQIDDNYEQSSNVLIEGLTFACERVFKKLSRVQSRNWMNTYGVSDGLFSSGFGSTSMHCSPPSRRSPGFRSS